MHAYLRQTWSPDDPDIQGIVYALPGLYGPHGVHSSGDPLPITMRDRVHVQGTGANRCIIRGGGVNTQFIAIPTDPCPATSTGIGSPGLNPGAMYAELLVDFTDAVSGFTLPINPPWNDRDDPRDTAEKLDGFTFQGGDVQVYFGSQFIGHQRMHGIISNCVFDMRHDFSVSTYQGSPPVLSAELVQGPLFGLMMSKLFRVYAGTSDGGYQDQRVLVLNNTFILAEFGPTGPPPAPADWVRASRPEAVAVIDFTTPSCGQAPRDPETLSRGLGNCLLINNVFRTRTLTGSDTQSMAMVGIDEGDTLVLDNGVPYQSNVFGPARVGAQNLVVGTPTTMVFYSTPVPSISYDVAGGGAEELEYIHCLPGPVTGVTPACPNPCPTPGLCSTSMPLPVPWVPLWDTATAQNEVDPAFVGEYLSIRGVSGLDRYADWRLLPGSPLKDVGWAPSTPTATIRNGSDIPFRLPQCPELQLFRWDGEHYGNPRIVDGYPDVGYDEIHLMVITGSYGAYSASHNQTDFLSQVPPPGQPERSILVPLQPGSTAIDGMNFRIYATGESPTVDPPPSWSRPPKTLTDPVVMAGLPLDYNKRYISFATPQPPSPWSGSFGLALEVQYDAPGPLPPPFKFYRIAIVDDECGSAPCDHLYFNSQLLILEGEHSPRFASNLQPEYR